MTNDQQIRFRTFADEDDAAWSDRDDHSGTPLDRTSAFGSDDPYLGATLPPTEPRSARSGALLAWGTGLALVAGVAIAVTLLPKPSSVVTDGPAANALLHIHRYVAPQSAALASTALLPCYVNGASVGSLTLTDCGRRNGVASGRLDVGLTSSPSSTPATPLEEPRPDRTPTPGDEGVAFARPQPSPMARTVRPEPTTFASTRLQPAPLSATEPSRSYAAQAYGAGANIEDDEDRSGDRAINPEDSVRAAQTFYEGLAEADGARAASVVVPEKRRQGPLSAGAIDRFSSDLQAPLRLTRLYPVGDHTVVARYAFVNRDGEVCNGAARVTTTERDGEVYVQGVRALNGC